MCASQNFEEARKAVLCESADLPSDVVEVKGYDFNKGVDYSKIMSSLYTTGFQATHLALAIEEINRMLDKKAEPMTEEDKEKSRFSPVERDISNCTIFLGYTSNMISSGIRESIRFLAEHNMVDAIVTSAGGVEEDLIKCLAPTILGDFRLKGSELRDKGLNRIGNLLAPNENYCKFEDWLMPLLDKFLEEQQNQGLSWTPSKLIDRLGKEINDPQSVYYWCHKNRIPVYCPGLTDGSLGDMLFFHSYKNPGLKLDIVEDLCKLNSQSLYATHSGMIIVGGGLIKHHICNANLMRNGADFCVYLNTSHEFDGSDAGASPDEAISWGKIKKSARPVKIFGDATILLPLIVAETFAKRYHHNKKTQSQ